MVKILAEDITSGSGSNCSNDLSAESDGDDMMFYHCKEGQFNKSSVMITNNCILVILTKDFLELYHTL